MAGAIGWPVAEQRLIYAGKALEDKRTLGGSGVLNNRKLRLQKPSVRSLWMLVCCVFATVSKLFVKPASRGCHGFYHRVFRTKF